MSGRWRWWVNLTSEVEHPRVLAAIRIAVATMLLWDFLSIGYYDLVTVLFAPEPAGGVSNLLQWKKIPWVYQVFPPTAGTAWAVYLTVVLSATSLLLGWFSRTSALILLVAYAQTALITPAGDRGIDLLLRNVLMILACSRCGNTWSADAWWNTRSWAGDGSPVPAWPRYILILQLVVMYFTAGIAKFSMPWMPMGGYSALFLLLQDPAVARFDFAWLERVYPLTQIATGITINWEYSAPVLLLVYYYRTTPDRPGRLRAFCLRYKVHFWWLGIGVLFHLGIFVSLELGIFPWAMLGLYFCFLHPDELDAALRWLRRDGAKPTPALASPPPSA